MYVNYEKLSEDRGNLIIIDDKEYGEEDLLLIDKDVYINWQLVKDTIDEDLFFDNNENVLIFTTDSQVKRYELNSTNATFNRKVVTIQEPIVSKNDSAYIPLNLIKEEYKGKIDVRTYEKTIVIEFTNILYIYGNIPVEEYLRYSPHLSSPVLGDILVANSRLRVLSQHKGWFYVLSDDGRFGYINENKLIVNFNDSYKIEVNKNEKTSQQKEKINLTWDYTYGVLRNTDNIKPIPGINTISPTWFDVIDETGKIYDKGNKDYVKKYRDIGVDIWPSVTNDFDPSLTSVLLNSSKLREKIINELLDIFLSYGFQGINIDFENVFYEDKDVMTQFMRELYPVFSENGLIVSMDVTGISTSPTWSMFLDRERLHKSLDYMVLMAYDQHWASSPVAGSVAEYPWVERSLKGVLELVPHSKIILGMPFYTRMWTTRDGKVSSQAIGMESAKNFVNKHNIELIWKDDIKQFYGKVDYDEYFYEIWIEDINSLFHKVSLSHKYDLGGIATWRKGFEQPEIWNALDGFLREEG